MSFFIKDSEGVNISSYQLVIGIDSHINVFIVTNNFLKYTEIDFDFIYKRLIRNVEVMNINLVFLRWNL